MKALLKIEWIKTWRSWPVFIMGIGMPVGFFLLFSSIVSTPNPEAQKDFLLSYMLTMTGFSMSSFGLFTFPYMLQEDQTEHWLTYIEHSKISISAYYLSKIFRVLLNFMVAIIVTFCVGAFVRDVELPLSGWLGSWCPLYFYQAWSFWPLACLSLRLNPNKSCLLVCKYHLPWLGYCGQVHGCLFPCFQSGFRAFLSGSPVYRINELVVILLSMGNFHGNRSCLFWLDYCSSNMGFALFIKSQRESDRG